MALRRAYSTLVPSIQFTTGLFLAREARYRNHFLSVPIFSKSCWFFLDHGLDTDEEDDDLEDDEIPRNHRFANMPNSLISGLNESFSSSMNSNSNSQLKKGILWQQRDKIFSRWKEKFFVLTKDYLQCFKKGTSRITEMGGFIYGIRLTEVSNHKVLSFKR